MDTIRIALLGADGRMGRALTDQIARHPNAHLVAGISAPDSPNIGNDMGELSGFGPIGVSITTDLRAALDLADVLIDFSAPKSTIDAALMMHDVRCKAMVSGTTGLTAGEDEALERAAQSVCLVQSGNFSLGVNMLEALVKIAAEKLADWDIEILEMHHNRKVDAPPGTALMLGRAAAQGRGVELEKQAVLSRKGMANARKTGEIGFAALRGGGVIGEHEVRYASELEMITLAHSAFDRSVFASGALAAALWATTQPKGKYDMADMLGIEL